MTRYSLLALTLMFGCTDVELSPPGRPERADSGSDGADDTADGGASDDTGDSGASDDTSTAPRLDWEIGSEEVAGSFEGSRPSIAVDRLDQPHMVIDQGWADTLYIYHRLGGSWSESLFAQDEWGSDRNYLPHIEIDAQDRAWISSWYATSGVVDECGQGVWLIDNMSTAPTEAFHVKIYVYWSNGNLSLDPQYPDQTTVMSNLGAWQQVDSAGSVTASGELYLGTTGEKLRFLISPRPGQDGVMHGAMSGWDQYESAYRNSLMDGTVTWASYATYPEQGEDTNHPSLGIDAVDPEVAYIAVSYAPGVVVNIWNGTALVRDPSNLLVVDASPATDGNGVDRFGPQWSPAPGGGAFLCWTGSDGWVRIAGVGKDGSLGSTELVTEGRSCSMATDSEGYLHMAYVNGGMRYRKILPPTTW